MNGPKLNLDWGKLSEGVKKFQYPLIVLLIGLVLLAWPSGGRQQSAAESEAAPAAASQKEEYQLDRLEQRLADSLSSIAGVGEAEVVLTLSAGSRDILAQDEEQRGEEFSRKTVILDGSDRQQTTVTTQVVEDHIEPQFQVHAGILQGAEPVIRIAVRDQDISFGIPGILQELGMEDIAVIAGDGIIRLFHQVIPGDVIVLLLPGARFLQGLLIFSVHRVVRKEKAQ